MDESVEKKQREAAFFLEELRKVQGSHSEKPDYYLSAFLSAARGIEMRLFHAYPVAFKAFRKAWAANNPAFEAVTEQMKEDRNLEVHERGSGRMTGEERIEVAIGTSYTDASGTFSAFGPPGCPPAVHIRQGYFFRINRNDVPVIDRCADYLEILGRIARDFAATLNT